jgi:hypothetical protein
VLCWIILKSVWPEANNRWSFQVEDRLSVDIGLIGKGFSTLEKLFALRGATKMFRTLKWEWKLIKSQ